MMDFLREHFQMICLVVAIIGVLVGVLSLIDEMRKRKKNNNR
jgi:hypothetical protein